VQSHQLLGHNQKPVGGPIPGLAIQLSHLIPRSYYPTRGILARTDRTAVRKDHPGPPNGTLDLDTTPTIGTPADRLP
jgi:hypothetical protein